jgi:hypothetical protein
VSVLEKLANDQRTNTKKKKKNKHWKFNVLEKPTNDQKKKT